MQHLPLFLLNTVLFPGQRLPLKVFETRYMDMVSERLKSARPFGVALIHSGSEVGEAAEPAAVGTLAHIERWEMPAPGVLQILVRGGRRFAVDSVSHRGKLALADVTLWDDEAAVPMTAEFEQMADFIRRIIQDFDAHQIAEPHLFDDASWVGMRLSQLLPVEPVVKQQWLAQRDPLARLLAIRTTLDALATDDGG